MKFLLLLALIGVVVVNGQFSDWTCNHWSFYTVDLCYQFSTSFQYLFVCNGTDSITFYSYTDGSCGDTDSTAWTTSTYDESSDTTDLFACDQSSACDTAIIRYYADEECTGDSYFDTPYISGQCYSGSSTSSEVSCSGDKFTIKTYTGAGDCTGSSVSVTVNYADYSDTYAGCWAVKYFLFFFFFVYFCLFLRICVFFFC